MQSPRTPDTRRVVVGSSATPSASTPTTEERKTRESLEDEYLAACLRFQAQVDAGVLVTLRHRLHFWQPSVKLTDNDLLAACQVLRQVRYVRRLKLNDCSIGSNGAYMLYELLQHCPQVEKLELRNNNLRDLGGVALSLILQIPGLQLRVLDLHWNHIGEKGARAIAEGLKQNYVLEQLDISHNSLGSSGARAIRLALMERRFHITSRLALEAPTFQLTKSRSMTDLDRGGAVRRARLGDTRALEPIVNGADDEKDDLALAEEEDAPDEKASDQPTGVEGQQVQQEGGQEQQEAAVVQGSPLLIAESAMLLLNQLETHIRSIHDHSHTHEQLQQRSLEEKLHLLINMDGNFIKEEILNSVTHGLGIVLSLIGSLIMLGASPRHSPQCAVAIWIYCTSLIFLYSASTLYHSFFAVPSVRMVFRILDYSGIFVLIAGTHTPILLVGFAHSPFHSFILFTLMWVAALIGVGYTAVVEPGKGNWKLFTVLFLAMNGGVVFCANAFVQLFSSSAAAWLVAGGVFYIGGIWFLQQDEEVPIMHAVWHLFVLAGSICHYFCILLHVLPMDRAGVPLQEMTFGHVVDNLFMGLPMSEWLLGASDGPHVVHDAL